MHRIRHLAAWLTVLALTLPADALARAGGGSSAYRVSPPGLRGRGRGGGGFFFFGFPGGGLGILLLILLVLFLVSRSGRRR